MAELQHLLVIVPWHAAETAPRPVVALTVLPCTTSLAQAFLRLEVVVVVVAVVAAAAGQSSRSLLGFQLDGGTTPAGCEFSLIVCCRMLG